MNKTLYCLLVSGCLMLLYGCATQQERMQQREMMKTAVKEAVAKRRMHIDITSMNTMRYGSKAVSSSFFLELCGDSVRSYLPYMGQAHQAPMFSPSEGLNFDIRPLSIQESHPKDNLSRLEIDIKTMEDRYLYTIELFDSGKAYIHVRSQHRDPISFDGDLSPFPEK